MSSATLPLPALAVGAEVDRVLADFLSVQVAELAVTDQALGQLAEAAKAAAVGGGKRLRPTFAYWGWRGTAGPDGDVSAVSPALAALELLHAFALVHDDVIDASPTRRGRPTAHRAMAADHAAAGLRGDPARFGEAAAILIGDLCLVWADRLLATAELPAATMAAARRVYDEMRVEAIAGQFLDLLGEASRAWSVEQALRVARLKTASYTVVRPLRYGAALHELAASGAVEAAYDRYGLPVGEAFQLRDDLLGAFGDPAVTGKPAGEDLVSGKPTVLLLLASRLAGPAQRAELDRALAAQQPDSGRLAALVAETGAPAQVERMIDERIGRALDALATAPICPATAAALAELAVAAARRST